MREAQKWSCAVLRAAAAMSSRARVARAASMADSDMPAMSPTSKSRPLLPSSMSSGTPPTRVAMVGTLAGHGFERGEAEAFHLAGHEHEVGERKEFVDVVLLAEEVDAIADADVAWRGIRRQSARGRRR